MRASARGDALRGRTFRAAAGRAPRTPGDATRPGRRAGRAGRVARTAHRLAPGPRATGPDMSSPGTRAAKNSRVLISKFDCEL